MTKKNINLKIIRNLKRLKKDPRWSQSDLSRETNLAYHTIAKIETGATPDPRISTVLKIAAAFKVPIEDLIK